ncbi:MAG: endonuclease [Ignavibacteriae bacterium]|nr:endonuclease [Ignavibacteriota bacterium]
MRPETQTNVAIVKYISQYYYLFLFIILFFIEVDAQVTLSQSLLNFGSKSTSNTDSLSFWIRNGADSTITINDINTYDTVFSVRDTQFAVQAHDSVRAWIYFYSNHNLSYQDVGVLKQSGTQGDLAISLSGTKQYPDTYYSSTQGLSGEPLKTALRNLVVGHTNRGYNTIRDKMFLEIDPVGGQLECVYTGRTIPVTTRDDMQTNGNFNTEHTWPQSTFSQQEPERADINHLFPTDENANNIRGNLPFDIVVSNIDWNVGGSKRGRNSSNTPVFEPRDVHKGNLARSMFYFIIRYQNWGTFWTSGGVNQELVFRTWNTQDPVSSEELSRNNEVAQASVQGKRNPFIDHPEFVARISDFDGTATVTTSPRLVIPTSQINFGTTAQFDTTIFQLAVVNAGSASLTITSSTSSDSSFSISFPSSTISADSYVYATVRFIPKNGNQSYLGTILINSTDTQTGAFSVNVSGNSTATNTAEISGSVFDDANENGIRDENESGLENWNIYISGAANESTLTDVNGNYLFTNLPAGTYSLTEEERVGWIRSFPLSNTYSISLSIGQDTTGFDFGNRVQTFMLFPTTIGSGTIIPSDTVILQYSGSQQFTFTPNVGFRIDSILVDDIKVDSLTSFTFSNVTSGHTIVAFFSPIIPTISGMKFIDRNVNGAFDAGDGILENWSIVLSGAMDDTTLTDVNGKYSFTNLIEGKYLVREIQQNGWMQTTENPDSITIGTFTIQTGVNFGNVFGLDCIVSAGWKMISNPLIPARKKSEVFPNGSQAFKFEGGYELSESLYVGKGYWMKFPATDTIQIFGDVISLDSISVHEGWNLIGTISSSLPPICIQPLGTTIESTFYEFKSGYVEAELLEPCKAYWVKVSTAGKLFFDGHCR